MMDKIKRERIFTVVLTYFYCIWSYVMWMEPTTFQWWSTNVLSKTVQVILYIPWCLSASLLIMYVLGETLELLADIGRDE